MVVRRVLHVRIASILAVAALATFAGTSLGLPALAHPALVRVGADRLRVLAAVQAAQWPQQGHTWCGVATVAAIARYRGYPITQSTVANYLNSAGATSPWGTPSWNSRGPGFRANISRDSGTDPRSLAIGLAALAHGAYHQFVDTSDALDATRHLALDLSRTHEPISVIVFHGQHSVLVSGILATDNPVTDPGSITGLEVWDPGNGFDAAGIQWAQMTVISLDQWLYDPTYWGAPYAENWIGGFPEDPDPIVGPYAFDPARSASTHLWIGHYVYIRPEPAFATEALTNLDLAYDQSGAPIPSFHADVPLPGDNGGQRVPAPGPTPPGATPAATAPSTPGATGTPATGDTGFPPFSLCIQADGNTAIPCQVLADLPWGATALPLMLAAVLAMVCILVWLRRRRRARLAAKRPSDDPPDDVRIEYLVEVTSETRPPKVA